MKILIVGAGEVGTHMATNLSAEHHHITVLEKNEKRASILRDKIDGRVLVADGTSVEELIQAEASDADLFFAVTSNNNANLVAASIANELGAKKTICRVHPDVQRLEWMFDYRNHFKIDYIFSSEKTVAANLAKHIRSGDALSIEEIARGRIEFHQVMVANDSEALNQGLAQLDLPERVRIASISRDNKHFIPDASTALLENDVLTLFGEPRKLNEVSQKLGSKISAKKTKNVVIFGGSDYALMLAQMLVSWDCKIRIFEKDEEQCEYLREILPEKSVQILNIDGTKIEELKEEQVGEADFFIATGLNDEDNVMTCLQAHTLGVKRCLTIIHRADYASAIAGLGSKFGIDTVVSPREAVRKELMTFVTSDRYHVISTLSAGELIEASISESSSIANKKVSEIKWPKKAGLVAIMRDTQVKVPAAHDDIMAGDNIFALVSKKSKRKFLKLL